MEDGENSAIGKNAQFPVEAPSIVDIVNVTTLHHNMVDRIVLWMAQLTSKLRAVTKILVQVGRIIKRNHPNTFHIFNIFTPGIILL